MEKPPGVFKKPPPGSWSNVSSCQQVAEPILKHARTANDEDPVLKGVTTAEPKSGVTGAPTIVECMKSMTTLVKAGQASGPPGEFPELQGSVAGPAPANETIRKPQIALEICCGHEGLAVAFCKVGFVAKGIDWQGNRHKPVIPILRLDLATPDGQEEVYRILRAENAGTYMLAHLVARFQWLLTKDLRVAEKNGGA